MDLSDKVVKLRSIKVLLTTRGRIGLEYKVSSTSWNQTNEPVRVLSHGHSVTNARSATWVIVLMHRIIITVAKLDTWPETVKTATVMGNLTICLRLS